MAVARRTKHHGALMFMDLDNFKAVNDTYGHPAGDAVLKETAARIQSCVRETDTVSRFGGDEFVILLSALDVDKYASMVRVQQLAEEIRAQIEKPYHLEGNTVDHHCTTSVGITMFATGHDLEDDLIAYADKAMYAAKELGKNTIQFFAPPRKPTLARPDEPPVPPADPDRRFA